MTPNKAENRKDEKNRKVEFYRPEWQRASWNADLVQGIIKCEIRKPCRLGKASQRGSKNNSAVVNSGLS